MKERLFKIGDYVKLNDEKHPLNNVTFKITRKPSLQDFYYGENTTYALKNYPLSESNLELSNISAYEKPPTIFKVGDVVKINNVEVGNEQYIGRLGVIKDRNLLTLKNSWMILFLDNKCLCFDENCIEKLENTQVNSIPKDKISLNIPETQGNKNKISLNIPTWLIAFVLGIAATIICLKM